MIFLNISELVLPNYGTD